MDVYTPQDCRIKYNTEHAKIANENEPMTYNEAMRSSEKDEWQKAMNEEIQSLEKDKTWEVVHENDEMNVIGCKWVYKYKKDENGVIVKHKARLVAKGYDQQYGIDYDETSASVLNFKSFRLSLALAMFESDVEIEQMDVKTAYLNAELNENIYMKPTEGMKIAKGYVLKLLKALYGLKQAGRMWSETVKKVLSKMGWHECMKDTCLYYKMSRNNQLMILGVFVDDFISIFKKSDKNEWNEMKEIMKKQWEMSDLGTMRNFLGMRLTRKGTNMYVDQMKYVNEKLRIFGMHECKRAVVPGTDKLLMRIDDGKREEYQNEKDDEDNYDLNEYLNEDDNDNDRDRAYTYRMIVGSLMYLSVSTRPDITHAVNMLSRYMQAPTSQHLIAAKKVLRYIKGAISYGLTFKTGEQNKDIKITAYSDSDWGGDIADRRSTTGYCVFVNDNLVSWSTKKQVTVALSSAEAELIAMTEVVKEVLWFTQLIGELKYTVKYPVVIYVDNQSAIKIAENGVQHDRTKHIDIRYHFVKDYIKQKKIKIQWLESSEQRADIFTKALLVGDTFKKNRDRLIAKMEW